MSNIINTSLSALAAASWLVCGNAVAQTEPVSDPDTHPPAEETPAPREERWNPDDDGVSARPEQAEEVIDEVTDPEFDPLEAEDRPIDPLDTDRLNSGPPTDDRLAGERIDSTLDDERTSDDDAEEAAEDR